MYWIVRRRQAVLALAAAVAVLGGAIGVSAYGQQRAASAAAAVGNWGLGFHEAGQPPTGNVSREALKTHNAYFLGDTGQKTIYLTFDCGYEIGNTAPILDALQKHHAPAAFFVVGHFLETAPELVQRMVAEGHTVGNHTWHHPDMSAIADRASFEQELQAVEEKYQQLTGQTMAKYYRPPQGKYSEKNLEMACDMGYRTFFWSLAYVDWYADRQPTAQQAFDKLLPRIHPGAIVLLHSTSATNAAILDELLSKWEEMGYAFGKISDLCTA